MSRPDPLPAEDRLVQLLAAWDEAAQEDAALPVPDASSLPAEVRPRLEAGIHCLRLLRAVLRPGDAPAVPEGLEGTTLGRFRVLRELGRGSYGVVVLAYDPKLGREVALKVPRPEALATAQLRERFLREARAAAALEHPNLVAVHEAGEAGPVCYIASAYCPGPDLAAWLRQQTTPVSARLAAQIVAALAEGLDHAHDRGVVHRDLKPANVLLAPLAPALRPDDGMSFVPRVTDFGMAKILCEPELSHTATGTILGTPAYMAPEQARGTSGAIGPAADIYALGAILYEVLVGRPPLQADSVVCLLDQLRDCDPVPPRRLRPRLPRDLETVCLKCRRKRPADRYASARDLAEDLRRFLSGKPVRARPVGPLAHLGRWCVRNRALAGAASAALLALVATLVLVLAWGVDRAGAAKRLGEEQQRTATALHDARMLAARLVAERGQGLCARGEAARGLVYLAQALKISPDDEEPFRRRLRTDLGSWRRQVHPLRAVLGHDGAVHALAIGAGGKLLAVAGHNQSVRLWELANGEPVSLGVRGLPCASQLAFRGDILWTAGAGRAPQAWEARHGSPARPPLSAAGVPQAFALSPDGRVIVTADEQGRVRRWDVASGREEGRPVVHRSIVLAVAFAADGRSFFTGCGTEVRRFDTQTGEAIGPALTHPGLVQALASSPDGKTLLVGGGDHTARRWGLAIGTPLGPPLVHEGGVNVVAFSPDGRIVATASDDRTARLWDADTGLPLGPPLAHADWALVLAFTPDGKQALTGGQDRAVYVWDVADPPPRRPNDGKNVMVQAHSPDLKTAVVAGTDRVVRLWDLKAGKPIGEPLAQADPVRSAAYSFDGRIAATLGPDHMVRLWDAATGRPRAKPLVHARDVGAFAFSPDGAQLATGTDQSDGSDNVVSLWDTTTGRPAGTRFLRPGAVLLLAFRPSGGELLAAGPTQAHLYDLSKPLAAPRLLAPCKEVLVAAFSSDGRALLTGGRDGTVRAWATGSGRLVRQLPDQAAPISAVALSADSRTAATGTVSGHVRLWNVSTGAAIGPVAMHAGWVTALAFSPDGQLLASGGEDGTARFWEADTGRPVGAPVVHPQRIIMLAFADARTLRTGSIDGTAHTVAVPTPIPGPVDRLVQDVEVRTGLALDEQGNLEVLSASAWQARRRRLEEPAGP